MRRLGGLVGLVALVVGVLVAPTSRAADDEVSAEEDNPTGCTTATSESSDQCGAQGRDHFYNADFPPPIEVCKDRTNVSGSRITRVLPDGPRREDGSLAFISGACVYLPPGYGSSNLRYPVVYLLHGGGGDEADWLRSGKVDEILDAAYAADPKNAVIAVMPDGRSGFWFDSYAGDWLIETYVLDHLVPYIDRHFSTLADRRGRAITGLSNGGYGAIHLAAKRPDLFVVAGAMSANIAARGFGNLGTPIVEGGPTFQEAGATYYGSVPIELASNLDPVDLTLDIGASCERDVTVDLCATLTVDLAFGPDNQAFRDRLGAVGYAGHMEHREEEGSHAWRWWRAWLRDFHLPSFFPRLADPQHHEIAASPVPASFRYRTIKDHFTIFGYEVTADAGRPKEFLDLTDVTSTGLTVKGSGIVTITTAARYHPKVSYLVDGAVVRADGSGRLTFTVDLGDPHDLEQYTPAQRVAERQAGDAYWTTRTVTITPAAG